MRKYRHKYQTRWNKSDEKRLREELHRLRLPTDGGPPEPPAPEPSAPTGWFRRWFRFRRRG
jgi:hypothetical protein